MSNTNFFNTTNSCNDVLNNCTIADEWSQIDERSQILAWKSALEPRLPRQDIRDRRAENVSERLLQAEEFRTGCAGSGGGESDKAIFLPRRSGGRTDLVGKGEAREIGREGQVLTSRHVSSLVIDKLCYHVRGKNVAVACLFFDFAAKKNSP